MSHVASPHFIIGTAGHVDHGKTSLIRALTGHETDRLREEQERGMSIDLGFADFTLPSGRRAGVIDVPGHERFLKNMLAGAAGIDLVLLVVAADEGVMPQTREHLEILQLLQAPRGVVVLTKADLVDADWLQLVREDLRQALLGTFLAAAPMVAVSTRTGEGIPELAALLDELAATVPGRPLVGPWRLPVDRVFTVGGFGTVVTGTLAVGQVRAGDRAVLLPQGREARVRGLQVHGGPVSMAQAGMRVAINLAGADVENVARGNVLAPPGSYTPTLALDLRLEVLPGAPRPVRSRSRVRVYLGTAEILARLNLLDAEQLEPGDQGYAQLRLESPTVAARGMRCVLRFYSPMALLGGGTILETHPPRHRRFQPAVLAALAVKEQGSPEERVAEALLNAGMTPQSPEVLGIRLSLAPAEVREHLQRLQERGVVELEGSGYVHRHCLEAAEALLLGWLADWHAAHPMLAGPSREEVRSRLGRQLDARGFQVTVQRLQQRNLLSVEQARLRLAEHAPQFTPQQAEVRDYLRAALMVVPYNPPFPAEILAGAPHPSLAAPVWEALTANGEIVRVGHDLYLHREAVDQAVTRVRAYLAEHGQITPAQFRDLLGATRKFAVPLMEWLDSERVTRRRGDYRELAS